MIQTPVNISDFEAIARERMERAAFDYYAGAAGPEVVDAIGGRAEVLMDGGVRRGADVLKALALGARAVLIGRPYLWGLAAAGEEGVAQVLALLRSELELAMALSGRPTIGAVDRTLVQRR